MSSQGPAINLGRWHRPRLYGMIVSFYLAAMSIGAAWTLAQYIWFETHQDPDAVIYGPGHAYYVAPPVGLMAVSGLAAFMLIKDTKGPFVKLFEYGALFVWTAVTLLVVFAALASASEADLKGLGIESYFSPYLLAYALAGINGMMYFLLHENHSLKYSYDLRMKSALGALSILAIGGFVLLAITYLVMLQNPVLSYSLTGHFPNAFFSNAASATAEGKAFLARYPDSVTYVFQDLRQADCCEVTFDYQRNTTNTCITNEVEYWCGAQGPSTALRTHLTVNPISKGLDVNSISLWCDEEALDGQPARWQVKGDIVAILQEKPDCWDAPPR